MLSQQPAGAVKHWMITCSCIICFIIDLDQFQPLNLFCLQSTGQETVWNWGCYWFYPVSKTLWPLEAALESLLDKVKRPQTQFLNCQLRLVSPKFQRCIFGILSRNLTSSLSNGDLVGWVFWRKSPFWNLDEIWWIFFFSNSWKDRDTTNVLT